MGAFNRKIVHFEKYDAMETVSNVVQGTLPNYLKDLPIPKSVLGWFSLGISDWMRILPFGIWNLAAVGGLSYVTLQALSNAPGIGPAIKDKVNKLPDSNLQKPITVLNLRNQKLWTLLTLKIWVIRVFFVDVGKVKNFLIVMVHTTNIIK